MTGGSTVALVEVDVRLVDYRDNWPRGCVHPRSAQYSNGWKRIFLFRPPPHRWNLDIYTKDLKLFLHRNRGNYVGKVLITRISSGAMFPIFTFLFTSERTVFYRFQGFRHFSSLPSSTRRKWFVVEPGSSCFLKESDLFFSLVFRFWFYKFTAFVEARWTPWFGSWFGRSCGPIYS